jgi:hypothetical protein
MHMLDEAWRQVGLIVGCLPALSTSPMLLFSLTLPRLTFRCNMFSELASLLPCLQDVLPDDAPDQWTHDINREALHHKGRV